MLTVLYSLKKYIHILLYFILIAALWDRCYFYFHPHLKLHILFLEVKCFTPEKQVNEKSEKVTLKLNIQKTKIMASGPITPWQIDGETMETVKDFIFLGSKITADGDCNQKLKDAYSLEGKLWPT